MSNRLPLSVQHIIPGVAGPISTFLLLAAVALGLFGFGPNAKLFQYLVLLLLIPPIGRTVWSFVAGRPVVTGRLDQQLVGTDILLVVVALLEVGKAPSAILLILFGAGCFLGLLLGTRRVAPTIGIVALTILPAAFMADIGWGTAAAAIIGLIGLSLGPAFMLDRSRLEAVEAKDSLRKIQKMAHDLKRDSGRRQSRVRQESFSPEVVRADLNAMSVRVQEWLTMTCRTLADGTGADRCLVYRPNMQARTLDLDAASDGPGDVVPSVDPREGIFGVVLKTNSSLMMPVVNQPYAGLIHTGAPEGINSLLVVPLIRQENLWGVIVLDATTPEAITKRDRLLVEGIVPLLLSLLGQLADLSAYRQGSGEDKMLHETSQQMARLDSLEGVAKVLVEQTVKVVEAQCGALAMLQDDSSLMVIHATGFDTDPAEKRFPFDKTTSLVAQSIRHAQTITQDRLGGSRRPPLLFGTEIGHAGRFTDVMVTPLLKPGGEDNERTCIGAICLCRQGNRPFKDNDKDRVDMVTNQAAAHLLNIQLLEDSRTQAATDGLTGLPNRRAFVEKLDEMLHRASRFGTPVSLLILDVDKFKNVNDTYGHPVGDQVLRRLAGLLHESVREAVDMAARYGGEEFALLLENTPHDGALNLAERLRAALEAETFLHMEGSNAIQFKVTISIGVSSYPEAGDSIMLVEKADGALYEAKETGRNKVVSGL